MLTIRPTTKAKRDIKKLARQNKDISKLYFILELLASGEKLPEKNRDHALTGNYVGHRGCHVEPDWILIRNSPLTCLKFFCCLGLQILCGYG